VVVVRVASSTRCAVRTALMPSLHNVSIIFHNPQHKEILMRHASSMPTLCPRAFLNHDTIYSNCSSVFLQFMYFRLIEVLRRPITPYVVIPRWVHKMNRSDFCRSEIHLTIILRGGFHTSLVIKFLLNIKKSTCKETKFPVSAYIYACPFSDYIFSFFRKYPIDF